MTALKKARSVTHRRFLLSAGRMTVLAAALFAGPAVSQELDGAAGVTATGVTAAGEVVVRNGEALFACALVPGEAAVALLDCRPLDLAETLAALTEAEIEDGLRQVIAEAGCQLSSLRAIGDAVIAVAESRGLTAEELDALRAEVSRRADQAVDRLMAEGALSVSGGMLVLDDCP